MLQHRLIRILIVMFGMSSVLLLIALPVFSQTAQSGQTVELIQATRSQINLPGRNTSGTIDSNLTLIQKTASDISGVWSGSDTAVGIGTYFFTLNLIQSGVYFSGTHTWSNGATGTITGTINGQNVTWTRIDTGSSYRVYFSGTLSLDYKLMSGTWTDGTYRGTWQATKEDSEASTHIVSDATVKYSKTLASGWETLYFDDAAWPNVVAPSGGLCNPASIARIPNSAALPVWGLYPQQYETIYARKVFAIQNPMSAIIRTLVDDDFDLYVNGVLVRSDWNGTWSYYQDDISSLVHSGINVVALKATDTSGGCQNLAFDVTVDEGTAYTISGRVTSSGNVPISAVTVAVDSGYSATTDTSGYYTITDLITSTYTITPTKAGYIFSPQSRTVGVPPNAMGQNFIGSDKNWTVMIYLDGDNNLDPNYVSVFNQLESAANNNAVNVIAAWDRLGSNNSAYYKVIYDANLHQLANYTEGVNRWSKGELNMGSPTSLSDFIQWARTNFPAQHYALFISNHGTGLNGTARDQTSGNDWITIQELGSALATATGNGSNKLGVVFADSCLMAMMEDAYQIRNYADYYVASENLIWITNNPSSGPYDNYIASISSFTSVQDFATSLVAQYEAWLDNDWSSLPYTLSAVDLSRIDGVITAIKNLAVTLKAQMNSFGTQIAAARAETQRFDSTNNFRIEANDQYLDLYDFATHIAAHIGDSTIVSEANAVTTTVSAYVVAEAHQHGDYQGPETNGQKVTWNLDHAHGVSIFFPPNRSSFYDVSRYDFAEGGTWPTQSQRVISHLESGEVQWAPMLIDYFQVVQPGGPDTPNPPNLVAPPSPPLKVYLPLIVRVN